MHKNPTILQWQVSGSEVKGSAVLCLDFGVSIAYLLPEVYVKAVELNETLSHTIVGSIPACSFDLCGFMEL